MEPYSPPKSIEMPSICDTASHHPTSQRPVMVVKLASPCNMPLVVRKVASLFSDSMKYEMVSWYTWLEKHLLLLQFMMNP
jgi:hypothetical protein